MKSIHGLSVDNTRLPVLFLRIVLPPGDKVVDLFLEPLFDLKEPLPLVEDLRGEKDLL